MFTTCSHWVGEFYVSYAVSYMLRDITYGTFLFFGTMTVFGGIFVWLFVPETQGVPLEDMDVLFGNKGLARKKMKLYDEYKAANMAVTLGEPLKDEDRLEAREKDKSLA